MSKYNFELKKQVIEYYINNNYAYHDVARHFDIPNINLYKNGLKNIKFIEFTD